MKGESRWFIGVVEQSDFRSDIFVMIFDAKVQKDCAQQQIQLLFRDAPTWTLTRTVAERSEDKLLGASEKSRNTVFARGIGQVQ